MLIETQYLPPLAVFVTMKSYSQVLIDTEEPFKKSSLRNRCKILGANGVILLTIPVAGGRNVRAINKDVRIDYSSPWQRIHWGSIFSAYGKSPFFLFYKDLFAPFYEKRFDFLIDFNFTMLETCCAIFSLKPLLRQVNPTTLLTIHEAKDLRNREWDDADQPRYHQVFEEQHGYVPGLGVIDAIFNVGADALYLKNSPG